MGSSELDRNSGVPLYRQIMDILRDEISGGEVRADEPLTEAKLIARFKVSLAPIRQALRELTQEGFIYRQQGRGTFPVEGIRVDRPADLKAGNLYAYLLSQGLHPLSKVSGIERVAPPTEVQKRLGIPPQEDVLHFMRLISLEGKPIAENDIYIRSPHEFLPDAGELDGNGSALTLLEQRYGIELGTAQHEAWATSASSDLGAILEVDPGSPVLVIDTLFRAKDGSTVGWRSAAHKADGFKYHFDTPA